jgi:hypothetical protein
MLLSVGYRLYGLEWITRIREVARSVGGDKLHKLGNIVLRDSKMGWQTRIKYRRDHNWRQDGGAAITNLPITLLGIFS